MANVLSVGIATLDLINLTDSFPTEDSEVRALQHWQRRGGNATNTLVVLSQLGHQCRWAGTLADDHFSGMIEQDLQRHHIALHDCQRISGGTAPTSFITLNQQTGTRTIVHYRDLPEFSFAAFQQVVLTDLDWLHFEGRNVVATRQMISLARKSHPQLTISVEIEKPRPNIEQLFPFANYLFFSRHYANSQGHTDALTFLRSITGQSNPARSICAWGEAGAYAIDSKDATLHATAIDIPKVVDSIGAGDTFNAGFIHATLRGDNLYAALRYACYLAGNKCTLDGLDQLAAFKDQQYD